MKARLFWKLGLTYVVLLLVVVLSVDFYSSRIQRRDYLRAAQDQLSSLTQVASTRPPNLDDRAALADWAEWMAKSGARVTVIDAHGVVLADSEHDPESMENHSDRPEVIAAFSAGHGTSVRHSHTLNRDLVYWAVRIQANNGTPAILRFAIPLAQVDQALAEGFFLHFLERFFSRLRKFHLKSPYAGERFAEKAPDFLFIIHD